MVMLLLTVYAIFVGFITLSPHMPGASLTRRFARWIVRKANERGVDWVDFLTIEFFGNILMFIPLGFFAALLVSRRAWWTLLLMGTAFSAFIEFYQATFLSDRVPEVRDLISNTTGFLIGATVAITLRLIVSHRDRLVEQDRRAAELARQRAKRPIPYA